MGGAVGVATYLLLTPVLEASTGLVRELQGFSWNLVPGLLIVGALLGAGIGFAARRRRSRGSIPDAGTTRPPGTR